MHACAFKDSYSLPTAVPSATELLLYRKDHFHLRAERSWRCLADVENDPRIDADIVVSRWTDIRTVCRQVRAPSSLRHVISVALKPTYVKITRDSLTVFDGPMLAGTLHIAGPGKALAAEFRDPCDFLHLHVSSGYLRKCREQAGLSRTLGALNDLIIRDPLAELLGQTLIANAAASDGAYADCFGQTLTMHIARLGNARKAANALPNWRLRRVHEYVDEHLAESIGLADLAEAAGLSRMHFAAQFRVATGYPPHHYVLHRRIDHAKELLSGTHLPLVEVALAVGFQEQSHFSTVFKRFTDETPARWRRTAMAAISDRSRQRPLVSPRHQEGALV